MNMNQLQTQGQQTAKSTTQMATSRQTQEVQMAMYVAKTFPRDQQFAVDKIMSACQRTTLAESAMYEYPRGGEKVTGPSIRLAEAIAQNWGNIDFGVVELDQKDGESTVMAYAWDLETNTRQTKIFTVKHERGTKKGIKKLEDPRDIYEMVANNGARRLRACILGVVPGDVVEAAVEKCKETLKNASGEPLKKRVEKMVEAFKKFNVTKTQLEKMIGCNAAAFSENDVIRLRGVYQSLKDGMSKIEDYFETEGVPDVANKETLQMPDELPTNTAPESSDDDIPPELR